jgi:COP9 signalosome complex subunit 7
VEIPTDFLQSLKYETLLSALQVDSIRELEDLIIDVIYANLLAGKMHHQEQVLHVDSVSSRDVKLEDLGAIKQGLQNW